MNQFLFMSTVVLAVCLTATVSSATDVDPVIVKNVEDLVPDFWKLDSILYDDIKRMPHLKGKPEKILEYVQEKLNNRGHILGRLKQSMVRAMRLFVMLADTKNDCSDESFEIIGKNHIVARRLQQEGLFKNMRALVFRDVFNYYLSRFTKRCSPRDGKSLAYYNLFKNY